MTLVDIERLLLGTGIVGALVSPFAGHILARGRDKQNRMRLCHDQLSGLKAKLSPISNGAEVDAYLHETRSTVDAECVKVLKDVRFWKRRPFNTARADYCEVKEREDQLLGAQFIEVQIHGTRSPVPAPMDTRSRKRKMEDALQELIDLAA
jgi:hypothetical protein